MVENAITLTQLLQAVEMSIRLDFCEAVWVKAEIDDFSVNGNGHAYMHLIEKDGEKITARCNAHIWNSRAGYIITKFEEATERRMSKGIKVLMQCGVEFTAKFGFALNILDIDPAYTIGDMAMQREAIVKKLKEDGVFDMNRELEFPKLPQRIAVISSRTAAGYGDFMDQLHNSGYAFRVQLFQSTMQGEKTAESIIDSLNKINDNIEDFDVVVIIR